MPYRVIFREAARQEASEAALWIRDHGSPDAAARWYDQLERSIMSLEDFPSRCPLARESLATGQPLLRQLVVGSYRLIFFVDGDLVEVLHVRHVARSNLPPL